MDIEDAIRWAYRDELPKAGRKADRSMGCVLPAAYGYGHGAADMVADLWAFPDNAFGVTADPHADGDPHPDALAIHQAVISLDAVVPEIPTDWSVLDGLDLHGLDRDVIDRTVRGLLREAVGEDGALVRDETGAAVLMPRVPLSVTVRKVALLGLGDLTLDPPSRKVECGANGAPRYFRRLRLESGDEVEVDGFDLKRRIPYPDAYQKAYLDPDPVDVLIDRCRAELWRAALDYLFAILDGALTEIVLQPTTLPPRPWEGGGRRVLVDKSVAPWKMRRINDLRPRAGARWRGYPGEVLTSDRN